VFTPDGNYGNTLQAALIERHETTALRLLEAGADINAQGGSPFLGYRIAGLW
jgi:hypothetical protein